MLVSRPQAGQRFARRIFRLFTFWFTAKILGKELLEVAYTIRRYRRVDVLILSVNIFWLTGFTDQSSTYRTGVT